MQLPLPHTGLASVGSAQGQQVSTGCLVCGEQSLLG
jgi:hypothetical protein